MSLQRKKVTVRTKKGKVYQRSMLVKSTGKSLNKKGKLNALNPWEQHHTEHVSTNSALGERARAYGSSGPGSDHSWAASMVGIAKAANGWQSEHANTSVATREHAQERARSGRNAATWSHAEIGGPFGHGRSDLLGRALGAYPTGAARVGRGEPRFAIEERYGAHNIHEVYQDPRKWVR